MRAILRFLDLFNPFSRTISSWHIIIRVFFTALVWLIVGVGLFDWRGTNYPSLFVGLLLNVLIWQSIIVASGTLFDTSKNKSSRKSKNEKANEALLTLLDVLTPDEREVLRERLMISVSYEDERIPAGIWEDDKYSARF